MRPGDCVRTPYVRHYYPPPPPGTRSEYIVWTDVKAPEKHVFVLVLLGAEPKDGSAPLDGSAALKEIGWHPDTEVAPLRDALAALKGMAPSDIPVITYDGTNRPVCAYCGADAAPNRDEYANGYRIDHRTPCEWVTARATIAKAEGREVTADA